MTPGRWCDVDILTRIKFRWVQVQLSKAPSPNEISGERKEVLPSRSATIGTPAKLAGRQEWKHSRGLRKCLLLLKRADAAGRIVDHQHERRCNRTTLDIHFLLRPVRDCRQAPAGLSSHGVDGACVQVRPEVVEDAAARSTPSAIRTADRVDLHPWPQGGRIEQAARCWSE